MTVLALFVLGGLAFAGRQLATSALPDEPAQVFYAPVAASGRLAYVRRSVLYMNPPGGVGLGADLLVRSDTLALCVRPLPAAPANRENLAARKPLRLPPESPRERCPLRWRLPSGSGALATPQAQVSIEGDTLFYAITLPGLDADSSLVLMEGGPDEALHGLVLARPLRRRCIWRSGPGLVCVLTNRPAEYVRRNQYARQSRYAHQRGRGRKTAKTAAGESHGAGAGEPHLMAGLTRPPGLTPQANRLVLRWKGGRPLPSASPKRRAAKHRAEADSLSRRQARQLLVRLTEALEALAGIGANSE